MKTVRVAALWALGAIAALAQYTPGGCTVTVVDESGAPIAGAQVHCVNWDYGPSRTTPLQADEQGVTDAQGRVTFHMRYVSQSFARVVHGKLGGWFRLQETGASGTAGKVTPALGRTIRGTLKDESGEPVAGALVLIDGCLPAGETDKHGAFSVPNVGVGYASYIAFYKTGFAWGKESLSDATGPIDLVLGRGFSVRVKVLDPGGTPAQGAHVYLYAPQYENRDQETDADGTATFYGVPSGQEWQFEASLYAGEKPYRTAQRVALASTTPDPVELTLTLAPAPPPRPNPSLRVRVAREDNGKPVAAVVMRGYDRQTRSGDLGVTDGEGRFVVENFNVGEPWISARMVNPLLYVVGGPVQIDFEKAQHEETVLKVAEGCCIRGSAHSEDGVPIVGRWVQIQPEAGFSTNVLTREDGRFTFANLDGVGVTYQISLQDELGRSRTATVGPMKQGEIRDGVELVFPPMAKPHVLRLVVKDASGGPVPGVEIHLMYEGPSPAAQFVDFPITDDAGRCQVKAVESGRVKAYVHRSVTVGVGEQRQRLSEPVTISQNETFDLDAAKDSEVELVVALQKRATLAGFVVDDTGRGIQAQVKIVHGDDRQDSASVDRDGSFLFQNAPAPPFLVEAALPEYQARVVPIDAEALNSGAPLAITLKRGPFAIGESVWSVVTGKPATEAAAAEMRYAAFIRRNEARYYRDAQPRPTPVEPLQPGPQFYTPRVRFVDETGTPLTRVFIQVDMYMPAQPSARYVPSRNASPAPVSNSEGIYNVVANGVPGATYSWTAWADGKGRVARQTEPSYDPNAIVEVALRPACTIDFAVRGADGKPAANVPVCALGDQPQYDNTPYLTIGTTNDAGTLRLEQVEPGAHAFMVGVFGVDQRLVAFRLKDGEAKSVTVDLSTPLPPVEALLKQWRTAQTGPAQSPEVMKERLAALDAAQRAELARCVREELDVIADLPRNTVGREPELLLLVAIASGLGDAEAAPIFERAVRANQRGIYNDRGPEYTSTGAMTRALAALEGDAVVDFFEAVALDETLSVGARLGALSALGRTATPKSAAAYKRIRDAWRTRPGMPPAKESYTHAERMAEAVYFYRVIFAREYIGVAPPGIESLGRFDAVVDPEYKTGTVHLQYAYGGATYNLVRVGGEWMVTGLESEVMV